MEKNKRITIMVASKDRHSEIALLIQSLRTQTYQGWDLVILDECQTPIEVCDYLAKLLNRIRLENHCVKVFKNEVSLGVCNARNMLIKLDYFNNPYVARLDDDVILESDYLKRLVDVIEINGYDIASGVTPLLGSPDVIRNADEIGFVINEKEIDQEGNIVKHGDDCGYTYNKSKIFPTHEFRSNALMKKEVLDAGVRYPTNLSPVGFREEAFFSFSAQYKGFKIGVDTSAVAYHLVTPSGGCRFIDYADKVQSDDKYFRKWVKEKFESEGLPWKNLK